MWSSGLHMRWQALLQAWKASDSEGMAQAAATSDEDTIREWLMELYPGANYGIPTGSNPILNQPLIVVDADLKDGINGVATLDQEAFDSGERLPDTVIVATGGGGRHLYYLAPTGSAIRNRADFLRGVDLRGAGGYVLGAGSHYISGNTYAYMEESGPEETPIVECPDFLLSILNGQTEGTAAELGCSTDYARASLALDIERENRSLERYKYCVSATANPPRKKFLRLWMSAPKFSMTYNKRRGDLKDQSFSAYMMSLAGMVVPAGWTDQEVVDLFAGFLRRHRALQDDRGRLRLRRPRIDSILERAKRYADTLPKVPKPLFHKNQENLAAIIRILERDGPLIQAEIARRTQIDYAVVKNLTSRWWPRRLLKLADGRVALADRDQ